MLNLRIGMLAMAAAFSLASAADAHPQLKAAGPALGAALVEVIGFTGLFWLSAALALTSFLMVQFVREGKIAEFICAGGVLSHYVGDACQPLHVSFLHHGRPDHPEEKPVHSKYETSMLDTHAPDIIEGVNQTLAQTRVQPAFRGGHAAALAVVNTMSTAISTLPPMDIINAFDEGKGRNLLSHMWSVLGEHTIACLAEGCKRMAEIWTSAWEEGGGKDLEDTALTAVPLAELKAFYNQKTFLPSFRLTDPPFAADLQEGQVPV